MKATSERSAFSNWPVWWVPAAALAALVAFTISFEWITKGESILIKPENVLNILRQVSFVGIIAMGMTLVITLGGIDLSVGSLVAFLGGIGILLMNALLEKQTAEWTAVVAAGALIVITGTVAGALNGFLVAKGKLAPFIATLGGLAAYRSVAMALVAGGEYRSESKGLFGALGAGGIPIPGTNMAPRAAVAIPLLLPWPVLIFAIAAVLSWTVLNRTRLGRYIVAIGSNERSAIYSAINVDRVKMITYSILGFCTGVAALLSASRLASVSSSSSGTLYELDVIASVVIGGTRMRGGSGVIVGTVIGALILGVIQNMLNLLQVSVYLQGLVKGLIIVGAVLLQRSERV
jgi:ribose transport system permease protein